MPVLQDEREIKNLLVAKALLNSIVLPTNLEEYMGISQQTLVNRYYDLQYEVNSLLYSNISSKCSYFLTLTIS